MPELACGICGQSKQHVLLLASCGAPPQFANPNGSVPAIDPMSLSNIWFLPSWGELAKQQKLLAQVAESSNFRSPRRYADISDAELGQYAGVFLPGGARCRRLFHCMKAMT
jgi:putative intracellular protease/amidase